TSTGTDTYSAIAAGIGSLKGPRHGGANIKTREMVHLMEDEISDITNEGQVADYLTRIIRREAGDRSGLIYGMGHAIYTISDPRALLLKQAAKSFCQTDEQVRHFRQLELIETLTPQIFRKEKGDSKVMCANVDLYSGLVYDMLGIPEDLFTPLFTVARVAGWAAHRLEELTTGGRIIRPAYKNVSLPYEYIALDDRTAENVEHTDEYIPSEERLRK
ncbi:MAG TPA: citrate synthase, partial [Ruminococcaceae bacterium]|nr:citrate synthase [Oscillospiraceae bacterium]